MLAIYVPHLPEMITEFINGLLEPTTYFILSVVGFWAMIQFRTIWTRGWFISSAFGFVVVFYFWSLTNENFRLIVGKPDNVPISILFFSLAFFLWVALRKMVINDRLIDKGLPTFEQRESNRRVYCWPDLVYTEFLVLILCTVLLLVWVALILAVPILPPIGTRTS